MKGEKDATDDLRCSRPWSAKEVETYYPDNGPHSICFRSWDDVGPVAPETKESVRLTTAFIKKHFDKVPK